MCPSSLIVCRGEDTSCGTVVYSNAFIRPPGSALAPGECSLPAIAAVTTRLRGRRKSHIPSPAPVCRESKESHWKYQEPTGDRLKKMTSTVPQISPTSVTSLA